MISFLQVENISKSFGDLSLFENISFGVGEGQRVALIAKNGSGKTTLLNILAGKESCDSGNISYRRDLKIAYLEQDPVFPKDISVIEACFFAQNDTVKVIAEYEKALLAGDSSRLEEAIAKMDLLGAWDYEQRSKQILSKLKINDLNQSISQLSGGQIKRVALANVLICSPDILILDEPTNHLDLEMVEWFEEYLLRSQTTLLMVTHDRYFLDRVCSNIIEIDNNQIYSYSGNYQYYLEKRQERIEVFNAEVDKAGNLLRKELEWMRRMPKARGTKARSRVDAFYDLEEKASQRTYKKDVRLETKASYLGTKIFEAKYISKSYGDKKILDNFYYNFARFEKVGIVGQNGTGKSTFLKIILGEMKPDSGAVDIGETVKFGYYSQDGLQFDDKMKVIDVVREIAEEVNLENGKTYSVSQFLTHFLFPPDVQHNFVGKLSGGEKRRLYLCSVLMRNPNFLVLDEPTNDLDIFTLNVLEDYLQNFKGCLLVVSHDRYFMDKIVDHLLVFNGDAQIKDFPGNYSDYRQWCDKELQAKRNSIPEKTDNKSSAVSKKKIEGADKPRKITFNEKREFEALELEIAELEKEKQNIEQELNSGNLSHEELSAKSQRISELLELIDTKSMRWLELSEI